MVFIYILQLEEGKFYVGKTKNPDVRIESHFTSNGSEWTKKYKPISVVTVIPDCDDYDEDKYTVQYMGKYGIDRVRGGTFCEIELNSQSMTLLLKMIQGATDKCYKCGGDHFIKNCPIKDFVCINIPKEKEKGNEKCDCPTSYFSSHRRKKCLLNQMITFLEEDICSRCGREGHLDKECYANRHKNGYSIKA